VAGAVCFSFYATKTLTTGEGGMLVTDDPEIAARARRMSLHGLDRNAWNRQDRDVSWEYDIIAPGFKYNLTDIAAAVGLVQLGRTDEMLEKRAAIARRYGELLGEVPALETPAVPAGYSSSWHLYMLRLRLAHLRVGRDRFVRELALRGVGTSVHFIPLHLHSYYRRTLGYAPDDFPVAVAEYGREISLPIYSRMTPDDVEHVGAAVIDVVDRFSS
jgi:perosamine synthetase